MIPALRRTFILLLVSHLTELEGQTLVQIHAKTVNEDDAGMARNTVDVELENETGNLCKITEMSTGSLDDYTPGEIGN